MDQIKPTKESIITPKPITPAVQEKAEVVKKLPMDNNAKVKFLAVGLVVLVAGVLTGKSLAGVSAEGGQAAPTADASENPGGETNVDESVFSDSAQGMLHKGGVEGEGTHYLDTGAGAEKYVYLLSTVLDLDPFVDKKVEVFGQTLAAEHAGWLMDVGRIKEVQ